MSENIAREEVKLFDRARMAQGQEEGYCPSGCGTMLFKRKRFDLGAILINEVCPTCLIKELKSNNLSAEKATQKIDLLIESYNDLRGKISGRSKKLCYLQRTRELSRLQKELEFLKEDIEEGQSTDSVCMIEFEERLQQAMLVIEDKVEFMIVPRRTEPSTLEQIHELRINMKQLEQKLCKLEGSLSSSDLAACSSGYALVNVLSQLEQVKAKATKDAWFLKRENQETREEIEELQVDLLIVQRTMANVPGLISDLSGDVDLLNKGFSSLRTDMENAEYIANRQDCNIKKLDTSSFDASQQGNTKEPS